MRPQLLFLALSAALTAAAGAQSTQDDSVSTEDNGPPSMNTEEPSPVSLQSQIYIVSGVLGGVVLALVLLVLALAASVASLKREVGRHRRGRYAPEQTTITEENSPGRGDQIHAYDNSAFGAHEMQERRTLDSKVEERIGYAAAFNGGEDMEQGEERYVIQQRHTAAPAPVLRLEDGVAPFNDVRKKANSDAGSPCQY